MFEGYSRNKYVSTGVIQWMLNNAFTEMVLTTFSTFLPNVIFRLLTIC